jgi:hypothetical protein
MPRTFSSCPGMDLLLASWLRLNSNWERFVAADGAIRNRNAYFYPIPAFGSAIIPASGEGRALKGRSPAGVLPLRWHLVFELGRCLLSPTNNQPLGLSWGGKLLGCLVAHFQILIDMIGGNKQIKQRDQSFPTWIPALSHNSSAIVTIWTTITIL